MNTTHPDHVIAALIVADPKQARARLIERLRKARMHKGDCAAAIGCAHSTLLRWIRKLRLEPEIEKLEARARREGWHHGRVGGRPEGSTVANGAAPRGSRLPG